MKIQIKEVYASDDVELTDALNGFGGRIISVQNIGEYRYKVIYETNE